MRLAAGRPPRRISQFVLKVHSRCDLACDHCYVYEHADQSWRGRPLDMSAAVVRQAAERIAEHAREHALPQVTVVLHGGEPLLMGLTKLTAAIATLRDIVGAATHLRLHLQTNGVLLTAETCERLAAYDVKVGVSLDGDRAANDRHRRFRSGATSHPQVLRALELLRRPHFRAIYSGLLCTVDIASEPLSVYRALLAQEPPRIDLLLPHATWDNPPPRPDGAATAYAAWLLRIHDAWTASGRPVPIRMFDSIRSTMAGGPSATEGLGTDPVDLIVIETDGQWEQADSLKVAYDGAAATGFDIFSRSVSEAAAHPQIAARLGGAGTLSPTCRDCTVVRHCGGGLYAHRYSAANGFDNPSVYCADLKKLITTMTAEPVPTPVRLVAPTIGLPTAMLDDLATASGRSESVRELAASHLVAVKVLLNQVADGATAVAAQGWDILRDLSRTHPAQTRVVLAHPFVREWLTRCRRGSEDTRSRIACLAAAVAIRAGVTTDVTVPVRFGQVHLPTVGTLSVADGATADLQVRDHLIVVRRGARTRTVDLAAPDGTWRPAQWVGEAGMLIEDADPYRSSTYEWAVAESLSPQAVEQWRNRVIAAWAAVQRDAPSYVDGVRECLRAIVPLRDSHAGILHSATARHAFGAMCASAVDGDGLAVMMVHETQHSKLGAILHLVDLCDLSPRRMVRVPWRTDERPMDAALQGIYAHTAVADVWRMRFLRTGDDHAAAEFRRYRQWTDTAIERIQSTRALTPIGERFVAQLRQTLHSWASA